MKYRALIGVLAAPFFLYAAYNVLTHNTPVDAIKRQQTHTAPVVTPKTSPVVKYVPGTYKPPKVEQAPKVDIARSNAYMRESIQALLSGKATTYETQYSGAQAEPSVHEFGDNSNNHFIDTYTFTNGIDPSKTFKDIQKGK